MKAELAVRKWGNSLGVRIPAEVAAAARLRLNQRVRITARTGAIVIEPVRRQHFTLDELVAGIHRRNKHEAVDFGAPVGNEAM